MFRSFTLSFALEKTWIAVLIPRWQHSVLFFTAGRCHQTVWCRCSPWESRATSALPASPGAWKWVRWAAGAACAPACPLPPSLPIPAACDVSKLHACAHACPLVTVEHLWKFRETQQNTESKKLSAQEGSSVLPPPKTEWDRDPSGAIICVATVKAFKLCRLNTFTIASSSKVPRTSVQAFIFVSRWEVGAGHGFQLNARYSSHSDILFRSCFQQSCRAMLQLLLSCIHLCSPPFLCSPLSCCQCWVRSEVPFVLMKPSVKCVL